MTVSGFTSQFGYAATGGKVHLGFMFDGPRCVQGPAITKLLGSTDGNRPELIAALLAADVKPGRMCGHCFTIVVRRAYAEAYAARPTEQAPDGVTISESDNGWTLLAFRNGKHIGSAARQCIGGSRGASWYWAIQVGRVTEEARRKPEARAELLRLAEATTAAIDEPSADDFAPIAGPSVAATHRQWLDRGLPASTWVDHVKRSAEG